MNAVTTEEIMSALRRMAQARRFAQDHATMLTGDLHAEIRGARQAGVTLRSIADAVGLSIAQVQRICDLSKDRSE